MASKATSSIPAPSARERLLKVATALFAQKGYPNAYVREIAARAGVTKPVLYYYFQSKEGLFCAILDWAAAQQEAILREVVATPGSVLERLALLYRRFYQGIMEHPNLSRMIHNLVFGPPQGAPEYDLDQYHRRMAQAIRSIYTEGLGSGEVRAENPDDVAVLVLGLLDFCFHMDQTYPENRDPERPERLLRMAFRGLTRLPDPGAARGSAS